MNKDNSHAKHALILNAVADAVGDTSGMRVLDLGADVLGGTVEALADRFNIKDAIGINPAVKAPIRGDRWEVISADGRRLPFPDEHFDLIVSVAAFEHFFDLGVTLKEAYRVLRKGGKLVTSFGPIWSGCWGHHLWVNDRGVAFTYQNTELPPWCHLLMPRHELSHILEPRCDEVARAKILSFVYDSDEQNHMFFDQYEAVFIASDFEIVRFEGGANKLKRGQYDSEVYEQARLEVECKFPNNYGFEFDSVKVVLRK